MGSRNLADLNENTRARVEKFLTGLENRNIHAIPICTYRSELEQEALYAQGRSPLPVTNNLRKHVGLCPISEDQNNIVTHAKPGQSLHQSYRGTGSLAVDLCLIEGGKAIWDSRHPAWDEIDKVAFDCGLSRLMFERGHYEDLVTKAELDKAAKIPMEVI